LTDYFKMDINIAYSIINMKLRDKYSNLDELCSVENIDTDKLIAHFNLTGKKSPSSIGGAMNCPIVF